MWKKSKNDLRERELPCNSFTQFFELAWLSALNVSACFAFAKALRTVLDYWQFENLHSLSFAIAKQLLISIFSLGRRSVRYCSLQPCQNPLCRQSASWLSALNVSACFAFAKTLRTLPTIRFSNPTLGA